MSREGDLIQMGIIPDLDGSIRINDRIYARNLLTPKGDVYYVDKLVTSSGTGKSWSRAYKTIAEAITVVNAAIDWSASPWATGAIILIAPGVYAENLTSLPYGAIMIGAGHDMRDGQIGTKIKPASGSPVNVGACINTRFINIGFESADTSAAFDADILNNCMFQDCYFTGPAETSTMAACIVTKDAVMNKIITCQFSCADKGIDVNYADGGDSFSHNLIKDCVFDQIDTAGIEISTNLVGPSSKVIGCSFFGGGVTMTDAIKDNVSIIDVAWCAGESTNGFGGSGTTCRSVNASYNNGALVT